MTEVPTLITIIQCNIGIPSTSLRKTKGIQIVKEEVKLPLFCRWQYIEIPNMPSPTLLELVDAFSKFIGYKVNVSLSHIYTLALYQKDKLRSNWIYNCISVIKYLGIKPSKVVKGIQKTMTFIK